MKIRPSTIYFVVIALLAGIFGLAALKTSFFSKAAVEANVRTARIVKQAGLTDLAMFTDARYTRHPSQADRHTAFQDHPLAFEHFPSGSFAAVPPHLFERNGAIRQ